MEETLDNAKEELKRVDHLIYVSLKYTRTCDVFKSIIERLINAIDFSLTALLMKLEEEEKIKSIPEQPGAKCNIIKEHFKDDETIEKLVDFYLLLRQINRSSFTRSREFRRHVTMTVELGPEESCDVNIDIITEYFKNTKQYIEYIKDILIPKND